MSHHSTEEARVELEEARKAGRRPAVWATEMAMNALGGASGGEVVSEAYLDALCDAVFGPGPAGGGATAEANGAGESGGASESALDAIDDAVFGRPGEAWS